MTPRTPMASRSGSSIRQATGRPRLAPFPADRPVPRLPAGKARHPCRATRAAGFAAQVVDMIAPSGWFAGASFLRNAVVGRGCANPQLGRGFPELPGLSQCARAVAWGGVEAGAGLAGLRGIVRASGGTGSSACVQRGMKRNSRGTSRRACSRRCGWDALRLRRCAR